MGEELTEAFLARAGEFVESFIAKRTRQGKKKKTSR
jgi:hypothetical protein